MNVFKKVLIIALSCIMAALCVLPAYADGNEGIMPVYYCTEACTPSFSIVDGDACLRVNYSGNAETFSHIEVRVKIQKKQLLGLYWSTVDIGEPDDQLIWTCYDLSGFMYETYSLSSTGTYRAVYVIKMHATDGHVDVIEQTIKDTY